MKTPAADGAAIPARVQTQRQMPVLTQSAPAYDVLVAADESEVFARLSALSHLGPAPGGGLGRARADELGRRRMSNGARINCRTVSCRPFRRVMNARDNSAWLAMRMIGEAATRTGSDRAEEAARLSGRPGFLHRGLQGRAADAAALEPAIAPADPALRRPHDRLGLAAGRLSASDDRTRHARPRPARNQMQAAMKNEISLAPRPSSRPRLSRGQPPRAEPEAAPPSAPMPGTRCRGASPACGEGARAGAARRLTSPLATPAHAYHAYVSNEKGNSHHRHRHRQARRRSTTVKVGRRPRGIELNKDGSELFILRRRRRRHSGARHQDAEVTGKLPSGPDPELLALSPDGDTIYVSNENDNLVTLIDVKRKGRSATFRSASSPRAWR